MRRLSQQGEGQRLEFKSSFAGDNEAIISLCAFTHAEGGVVFFGVKDDGAIIGTDLGRNTLENFANKVRQNSQPPLSPAIESIYLGEKTVVAASIPKSEPSQLFYAFNTPYIRVGKTNQVMSPDQQRARLMSEQDNLGRSDDLQEAGKAPVGFESFKVSHVSTGQLNNYRDGEWVLDIQTPQTVFKVSAISFHPKVGVSPVKPVAQIAAGHNQQLRLCVSWKSSQEVPEKLEDSEKRFFTFLTPHRPSKEWFPILVTFETSNGQVWGSLNYFQVSSHQRGFAEAKYSGDHAPFGWVRGTK